MSSVVYAYPREISYVLCWDLWALNVNTSSMLSMIHVGGPIITLTWSCCFHVIHIGSETCKNWYVDWGYRGVTYDSLISPHTRGNAVRFTSQMWRHFDLNLSSNLCFIMYAQNQLRINSLYRDQKLFKLKEQGLQLSPCDQMTYCFASWFWSNNSRYSCTVILSHCISVVRRIKSLNNLIYWCEIEQEGHTKTLLNNLYPSMSITQNDLAVTSYVFFSCFFCIMRLHPFRFWDTSQLTILFHNYFPLAVISPSNVY